MRYILWVFFVFVVQGCMTFSKYPLSDTKESDHTIFGTWSAEKNGNTSYLHIKPAKQKNMFILDYEESNDQNGDKMMKLKGYVSILKQQNYLNLKIFHAQDTFPVGYIFCQYRIDKDTLNIKFMNPEVIEKVIREKKIQGTIKKEGFFSYPMISEDTKGLREFIIKYHDTVFGDGIKEAVFYKESSQ